MDKVECYALRSSFTPLLNVTPHPDSTGIDVEDSGVFRRFISVDISGDVFEVPAAFAELAVRVKSEGYTKLVIPLYVGSNWIRPLSMTASILQYFGAATWDNRLHSVRTSKNEVYYGAKGLILDKDFMPLFVTTLVIENKEDGLRLKQANCRIPYTVFQRQDETLPKAIYKKLIPLYGTTPLITTISIMGRTYNVEQNMVEVKIGMGANIVFSSNVPKPSDATDEEFRKILKDNVDAFV